jgi:hypothetical protein
LILIGGFATLVILLIWKRRVVVPAARRWFSATEGPLRLAVLRILVFGTLLIIEPVPELFPGQNWDRVRTPWPWPHILPHLPDTVPELLVLKWTVLAAIGLAFVGLFTRPAAIVFCILGAWAYGLNQFTGKMAHTHLLWWYAAVCAAAPCGDALSIDAWWRRRRGRPRLGPHQAYALPIRVVWILLSLVYFFPGVWKVWTVGLEWMGPDQMRRLLHEKWDQLGGIGPEGFTPLFRIDLHPWLLVLGGVSVVLFEIGFVFAIWWPLGRALAAAGGLVFHWMNHFFMNILFWPAWIFYAMFIPFDRFFPPGPPTTDEATRARLSRAVRTVTWVGVFLVGGNLLYGVIRVDGWPFACYPIFNHRPALAKTSLEYTWTDVDGKEWTFRRGERTIAMDHARWDVLLLRAARPGPNRDAEVRRLWRILVRERSLEGTVVEAAAWRVARLIDPDQRGAPPVRREPILDDLVPP